MQLRFIFAYYSWVQNRCCPLDIFKLWGCLKSPPSLYATLLCCISSNTREHLLGKTGAQRLPCIRYTYISLKHEEYSLTSVFITAGPIVQCRCLKHSFWFWGLYPTLFSYHKVDLLFFFISGSHCSFLDLWYHILLPPLLQIFVSCLTFSDPFLSEHFAHGDTIWDSIFLIAVGRGDKYCSCVWTWASFIVCSFDC